MEAHLLAPMLEADPPAIPVSVALLVSGGHTPAGLTSPACRRATRSWATRSTMRPARPLTRPRRMLSACPYPGGPALAALASPGPARRATSFPRPMTDRPGLDFSFSGLKTFGAHTNTWRAHQRTIRHVRVPISLACLRGSRGRYHGHQVPSRNRGDGRAHVGHGPAASPQISVYARYWARGRAITVLRCIFLRPHLCTDNGAMIAYAGWRRLAIGERVDLGFPVQPRWSLNSLRDVA